MMKAKVLLSVVSIVTLLHGCSVVDNFEKSSSTAEYHAQLGAGYMQRGRLDLAKENLDAALKGNSRSPSANHYYAILQNRLGKPELAEKHFRKAMRMDGENPELLNNYGSHLCKIGEHEKAIDLLTKAIKDPLYKTPQFAYTNAAVCLTEMGRAEEAERYIRKALEIDPNFPTALLEMAELQMRRGNLAKAQAFLYRYNERAPVTAETLLLCYHINTRLQEHGKAERCSQTLMAKFPNSEEASVVN